MSKEMNNKTNEGKNGKGNGRYDKKPNGRRPKRGNSYQGREGMDAQTKPGYCNDPAWYMRNPVAAKKAGSLNFTYPLGYIVDLESELFKAGPQHGQQTFPGMMQLNVYPSLPTSTTAASALNVAAFKLYTFIRHENSGSRNYDAPDLLLYVLGVAELYAYVNWLQRIYLVANSYSVENAYIPRTLCALEGIDYEDVISNMADFAYELDNRLNKLRAYRCPGDMPIFARRAFMFKDIYIEGPSIKDQMYFFHPIAFYKFKLDADGAGMLSDTNLTDLCTPATAGKMTVSELFRGFDALLNAISSQEDFSIMSGDILKAYGSNVITIGTFDPAPSAGFAPVYNAEMLEQIQNCTVYGETSVDKQQSSGFTAIVHTEIKQDPTKAFLVCDPVMQFLEIKLGSTLAAVKTKRDYKSARIMTSSKLDPTPIDVMENSRLMAITNSIDKSEGDHYMETHHILCGTELIVGCQIGYYGIDSNDGHKFFNTVDIAYANGYLVDKSEEVNATEVRMISMLSHFKYSPCMHAIAAKSNDSGSFAVQNSWFNFEPSEYTIVTQRSLERLHDTAILSMLNV